MSWGGASHNDGQAAAVAAVLSRKMAGKASQNRQSAKQSDENKGARKEKPPVVLILLGLLLGGCGAALWFWDQRRSAAVTEPASDTEAPAPDTTITVGGVTVHPVALEDEAPVDHLNPQQVGIAVGEEEVESPNEFEENAAQPAAATQYDAGEVAAAVAPAPHRDGSSFEDSAAEGNAAEDSSAAQDSSDAEVAAQDEHPQASAVQEPESTPAAIPRPRRRAFPFFRPARRERKQWAQQHGFEYTKSDALLADEWTRNVAASGAPARDVVSGIVAGYEVHFADLAGVRIFALRRAAASDVVVELQRADAAEQPTTQPDPLASDFFQQTALVSVGNQGAYEVFSDEPAVAQRLIDTRFSQAVAALPATLERLWGETEWLIGEWSEQVTFADWDASLPAFVQLADAFRVLPPSEMAVGQPALRKTQLDPSRFLPEYYPEPVPDQQESIDALPAVERATAAVALPIRGQALRKGDIELRGLGTDEVDAIGDGARDMDSHYGTRVLRISQGSSIFDDIAAELGTNPLAERTETSAFPASADSSAVNEESGTDTGTDAGDAAGENSVTRNSED